jgi:anti-sigma regulatory factor (Ser/Thr protein kinase)
MTNAAPRDMIWMMLSDTPLSRQLAEALGDGKRGRLVTESALPETGEIGVVIADDAHLGALKAARLRAGEAMQSVFVTQASETAVQADFVLSADTGVSSVKSVIDAACEYRDQVRGLQADVARRKSAIGTIMNGQFVLRTLDEARNLSTMLALACPNSDAVVVGLQELMVNAVEHGNLEIGATTKRDLLMAGTWREEIERRLAHPDYSGRRVIVTFQRGRRMIAFTIQDEGEGFDHEAYQAGPPEGEGYRGRGITLARTLSFSSVTYMGSGSVVEAVILLDGDDA